MNAKPDIGLQPAPWPCSSVTFSKGYSRHIPSLVRRHKVVNGLLEEEGLPVNNGSGLARSHRQV
jgi:hypothetical protein